MKRRFSLLLLFIFLIVSVSGCSSPETSATDSEPTSAGAVSDLESVSLADTSLLPDLNGMNPENAVAIAFSETEIKTEASAEIAEVSGTALKIRAPGTYRLSGTCPDGSVTVAKETSGVFLILDGLHLSSASGPALTCNKSSAVCVYSAAGSENTLSDPASEHEEGAALKFKSGSALLLAGEGSLTVTGNYKNGIKGGAGSLFRMISGVVIVTAENNALACDHSLEIQGGTLHLTAQNDGIKASPDEGDTASLGNLLLKDGLVFVDALGDGISASGYLELSGGTWEITTRGEISSSGSGGQMPGGGRSDGFGGGGMGRGPGWQDDPSQLQPMETENETASDASSKGVKAGVMKITGGTVTVSSTDHALHSSGEAVIDGGVLQLNSSKGKGIATHGNLTVSGDDTQILISKATEGIESKASFTLNSGAVTIENASDDGVNLGGSVTSNTLDAHSFTMNGGTLLCHAAGDGIDSNGTFTVKGGTVAVFGPSNGGNSCLDVQYTSTFQGGTVLAVAASSSMWNEVVGHMSGTYLYNLSAGSSDGNSRISVFSSEGKELISATCLLQGTVGIYFMTDQVEDLSSCVVTLGDQTVSFNTGTGTGSGGMGGMGGAFPGPGGGDYGGGGGRPGGMRPGR